MSTKDKQAYWAIKSGRMVRPRSCAKCKAEGDIEAHHHKGYAPEYWLDVAWLCVFCHRKADAGLISETNC